jgi:hypothetical protein
MSESSSTQIFFTSDFQGQLRKLINKLQKADRHYSMVTEAAGARIMQIPFAYLITWL